LIKGLPARPLLRGEGLALFCSHPRSLRSPYVHPSVPGACDFQGDEAEPHVEVQGTVLSVPGLDRVDDLAHLTSLMRRRKPLGTMLLASRETSPGWLTLIGSTKPPMRKGGECYR
jgi:hypothetical protein